MEERQRRKWFRQTVLGVLTLALTPIPIVFYMAHTSDGYLMYLKARYSLWAPSTPQLPPDQLQVAMADRKHPTYGVPVLVYHGIGRNTTDTADAKYVISRTNFAEQMRALQRGRLPRHHHLPAGRVPAQRQPFAAPRQARS